MRQPPPIPLALFARTRAAVDRGVDLDDALVAAGLDPSAWPTIEEAWLLRLADDAERGVTATTEAFLAAYQAAAAPHAHCAPPPPEADEDTTEIPVPARLPTASLPFVSAPAPQPRSDVSPWARAVAAPIAPAAPIPPSRPVGTETGPLDPALVRSLQPLPFGKQAVTPAPRRQPPADITATGTFDLRAITGRAPLPFAPPSDDDATVFLPSGAPARGAAPALSGDDDERQTITSLGAHPARTVLPFAHTAPQPGSPAEAHAPLPLETYAAIAAAVANRGSLLHILASHSVTQEAWQSAVRHYQAALATDADLARRFSEAYLRALLR